MTAAPENLIVLMPEDSAGGEVSVLDDRRDEIGRWPTWDAFERTLRIGIEAEAAGVQEMIGVMAERDAAIAQVKDLEKALRTFAEKPKRWDPQDATDAALRLSKAWDERDHAREIAKGLEKRLRIALSNTRRPW